MPTDAIYLRVLASELEQKGGLSSARSAARMLNEIAAAIQDSIAPGTRASSPDLRLEP